MADLPTLYSRAIAVGLVWPRGHFFEKTEIKSADHARQEYEAELLYYLHQLLEGSLPPEVHQAAADLRATLEAGTAPTTRRQLADTLCSELIMIRTSPVKELKGTIGVDQAKSLIDTLKAYLRLLDRHQSWN